MTGSQQPTASVGIFTITNTAPTPSQVAAFRATVRRLMQPVTNQPSQTDRRPNVA